MPCKLIMQVFELICQLIIAHNLLIFMVRVIKFRYLELVLLKTINSVLELFGGLVRAATEGFL